MNRVVHFEIHAEDTDRAAAFYRTVFGWTITRWAGPEEYFLITTGPPEEPGINGGLMKRRGTVDGTAVIAYVCSIEVQDLQATLSRLEKLGGKLVVPTMAIPGVGWLAYCKDTEGNIFGVTQNDPSAR